ncbi:MAG TPA: hypothetical protein VGQ83_19640 [Polyangia bacterium]
MSELTAYETAVAEAIIGVDTLFGGDVNNPSGTGRFIADCWFSGKPLPPAYHHPLAARLRETGGVTAKAPDREAARRYLSDLDLRGRLQDVRLHARGMAELRRDYVEGLALSLEVMLDLVLELLGDGPRVPYERCVDGSTGAAPRFASTDDDRARVRDLLAAAGFAPATHGGLVPAVDAWRAARRVSKAEIHSASDAVIPELDRLAGERVAAHLPAELRAVPRANITFLPIEDAWFSGSMNYLGRARRPDGEPEYEATYEINAALEISRPEFAQLIAHEVVPGHVMTFALIQNLYHRGLLGFEATILTMNSRGATLSEGIANAGIYLAHGVRDLDGLPTAELRLGVLLAQLQDKAKNNASYLLYAEGKTADEAARRIREECLVSEERADKLARAWGGHPLLGRMYLPSYHFGLELVLDLLRRHGEAKAVPALYGAHGLVDCVTVRKAVR